MYQKTPNDCIVMLLDYFILIRLINTATSNFSIIDNLTLKYTKHIKGNWVEKSQLKTLFLICWFISHWALGKILCSWYLFTYIHWNNTAVIFPPRWHFWHIFALRKIWYKLQWYCSISDDIIRDRGHVITYRVLVRQDIQGQRI